MMTWCQQRTSLFVVGIAAGLRILIKTDCVPRAGSLSARLTVPTGHSPWALSFLHPPPPEQLVLDSQVVADPPHDKINEVLDRARDVVETRHRRQHRRPRLRQPLHVLELDARQWRLARDDDQLA